MSKRRSLKRSTGKKPTYEELPFEDFLTELRGAQTIATIYRRPDGQLMTLGLQLSEKEARRVAYFLVEQYALERNMTVEEYVFRMMRENEDKSGAKKA